MSAPITSEPFIICDNLVKIYRVAGRDLVALQGLDMIVTRGELMGVVGVSGSGKSTLMNILGGLDRPSAGRVWVGGKDLLKISDTALNSYRLLRVGFVWQLASRNLVSYLTAEQNIELPLTLAGWVGKEKKRRIQLLLEQVGIKTRRSHRLSELSGGEQQRVGIAVALANQPELLLADEPTGEVDAHTALALYELFRSLNQQLGLTTLIVSHDPELAHHVDRVVAIRDGKISSEIKSLVSASPALPAELASANDRNKEADAMLFSENSLLAVPVNSVPEAQRSASSTLTPQIQEYTVIDAAGRLQFPKELLERYAIRGRVHLNPVEQGVLVEPVQIPPGQATGLDSAENLIDQMEAERRLQRRRAWGGHLLAGITIHLRNILGIRMPGKWVTRRRISTQTGKVESRRDGIGGDETHER